MKEKRWYYVTVRQTRTWNVSVEASCKSKAEDVAKKVVGEQRFADPDYVDWDYEVEEVKKYVE
jgi:hypothetical protein